MNFIPAIIIALDPYSTALLVAMRLNLQRRFPQIAPLIQFRALVVNEGKLSEDIDTYASKDFDLVSDRLKSTLEQSALLATLEQETITLLRSGRDPEMIATAEKAGINIGTRRRIYCLATAAYAANRDIVPRYAKLIRFLLGRLFVGDSNGLELIALLPSLFENETTQACADTYGFLKVLDHHLTQSQRNHEIMLFDNHWLIDRTNSEKVQMPSLQNGLEVYAEALSMFLVREIEALGISVGDAIVKNKVAAFSSFGCSEAIFPINEIIERLKMTLASNLLNTGFLPSFEDTSENYRRLLLDAKSFVLQQSFSEAFDEIEQPRGKRIWQDFMPSNSEPSVGMVQAFIQSLNNQKQTFRERKLLGFKKIAEEASALAKSKIEKLLEAEIKQQADYLSSGLDRASQFLKVLVETTIAGNADILGEEPQNLVTNRRKLAAKLDPILGLEVNREQSQKRLQRIAELRVELSSLEEAEKNIFFTDPLAETVMGIGATEKQSVDQNDFQLNDLSDQDLDEEIEQQPSNELSLSQKILLKRAEFLEAWQQLQIALESEEFTTRRTRQSAIADKEDRLKLDIVNAEKDLQLKEKEWERCRERLADALEHQRNFLLLYLTVYLGSIVIITGVIASIVAVSGILGAIGGIVWAGLGIALVHAG